ncbi:MAG: hypothetical protein JWN75_245 [Candidatus Saccharibacteria bacterium]|nr:hypothetical protein [Candidatus Saccharibacteria bacterium]
MRFGISAGGAFSLLSSNEQWDLHNFYLVAQEMTDAELRLHRQVVKQVDPSLPQRAGRAFAALERGDWKRIDYAVTPKGRAITIRAVVKPKPDPKIYARAILGLAMMRQGVTPTWSRSQLDSSPPNQTDQPLERS